MIDVPKIAVIGSQSAGKSSILEVSWRKAWPYKSLLILYVTYDDRHYREWVLAQMPFLSCGVHINWISSSLSTIPDHLSLSCRNMHPLPDRGTTMAKRKGLVLQGLSSIWEGRQRCQARQSSNCSLWRPDYGSKQGATPFNPGSKSNSESK